MCRRVHTSPGTIKGTSDAGRCRAIGFGQEDDAVAGVARKMRGKPAELPGHVLMHEENIHPVLARASEREWNLLGLFMPPWCTSSGRASCWQFHSRRGNRACLDSACSKRD